MQSDAQLPDWSAGDTLTLDDSYNSMIRHSGKAVTRSQIRGNGRTASPTRFVPAILRSPHELPCGGGHLACRKAAASSPAETGLRCHMRREISDGLSGRQDARPRQARCPPLRFKGARRAKNPGWFLREARGSRRKEAPSEFGQVSASLRRLLRLRGSTREYFSANSHSDGEMFL